MSIEFMQGASYGTDIFVGVDHVGYFSEFRNQWSVELYAVSTLDGNQLIAIGHKINKLNGVSDE